MSKRNRPSKFVDTPDTYDCAVCGYSTTKKFNFSRHCSSSLHSQLCTVKSSEHCVAELSTQAQNPPDTNIENEIFEESQCDEEVSEDVPDTNTDFDSSDDDNAPSSECVFETQQGHGDGQCQSEWYPFESKVHFLLSLLYSSETHKLSDEVMKFVIFILNECGVKSPPLRRVKEFMRDKFNVENFLARIENSTGDISWFLKPSELLKLKLANPRTSHAITRLPTLGATEFQASGEKWRSTHHTHWVEGKNGEQFIRGQFVRFRQGSQDMYGKLTQFLDDTQNGTIKADVQLYLKGNHHDLSGLGMNESSVVRTNRKKVVDLADCAVVDLDENAQFLKQIDNQYSFVAMSQEEKDEALFKTSLWEGKPIINIPLNLFIDDMSGNVSRRWSPLHIVQGQIAGLPIKEKRRNETTMFISASESVSMMDLLAPICADINTCKENGVNAFDAKLQKEVTVTTDISVLVTDYQMTSLACNHMGPSASKFCPKCYVSI